MNLLTSADKNAVITEDLKELNKMPFLKWESIRNRNIETAFETEEVCKKMGKNYQR